LVKQRQSIYLVRQHEANRELTEGCVGSEEFADGGGEGFDRSCSGFA
jgi:hypothetical protein